MVDTFKLKRCKLFFSLWETELLGVFLLLERNACRIFIFIRPQSTALYVALYECNQLATFIETRWPNCSRRIIINPRAISVILWKKFTKNFQSYSLNFVKHILNEIDPIYFNFFFSNFKINTFSDVDKHVKYFIQSYNHVASFKHVSPTMSTWFFVHVTSYVSRKILQFFNFPLVNG